MARSSSLLGRALDRAQRSAMSTAATDQVLERVLDLRVGRVWIAVDELGGGEEPAVDAVAALVHLLFDPRGLDPVRLIGRAEPGERGDPGFGDCADGGEPRAHPVAAVLHVQGPDLAEPPAKARLVQLEAVPKAVTDRQSRAA